jgi:hypothetical protein
MSADKSKPETESVSQNGMLTGQKRLPYRSPQVMDYGNVTDLTQKAGSPADGSHGSRGCDPHRGW